MPERLPKRAAKLFIEDVLMQSVANDGFDPSGAVGFDPRASTSADAFLPVATTIDNVGSVYPSLVISASSETSGGESTYDYMTSNGPAQRRDGELVATARAEVRDDGYTGDSGTYSAVSAEALVEELINEVEAVCLRNSAGAGTDLGYLGSQRGPDAPDDDEETPVVRIQNCTISYAWLRSL